MNNNWLTSPAYMAVPGNIYNTILMDDKPCQEYHPNQSNVMDDNGFLVWVFVPMLIVIGMLIASERT